MLRRITSTAGREVLVDKGRKRAEKRSGVSVLFLPWNTLESAWIWTILNGQIRDFFKSIQEPRPIQTAGTRPRRNYYVFIGGPGCCIDHVLVVKRTLSESHGTEIRIERDDIKGCDKYSVHCGSYLFSYV